MSIVDSLGLSSQELSVGVIALNLVINKAQSVEELARGLAVAPKPPPDSDYWRARDAFRALQSFDVHRGKQRSYIPPFKARRFRGNSLATFHQFGCVTKSDYFYDYSYYNPLRYVPMNFSSANAKLPNMCKMNCISKKPPTWSFAKMMFDRSQMQTGKTEEFDTKIKNFDPGLHFYSNQENFSEVKIIRPNQNRQAFLLKLEKLHKNDHLAKVTQPMVDPFAPIQALVIKNTVDGKNASYSSETIQKLYNQSNDGFSIDFEELNL